MSVAAAAISNCLSGSVGSEHAVLNLLSVGHRADVRLLNHFVSGIKDGPEWHQRTLSRVVIVELSPVLHARIFILEHNDTKPFGANVETDFPPLFVGHVDHVKLDAAYFILSDEGQGRFVLLVTQQ